MRSSSTDPKVYWYVADQLGTVRDVVDFNSDGSFNRDSLVYSSYGDVLEFSPSSGGVQTGPSAAEEYTHRFAFHGQELDPETGLQYHHARYFDPGSQNFISEDPLQFLGGSTNLYQYGGGSPTNAVDRDGRVANFAAGGLLGLGGVLGLGAYLIFTPWDEQTYDEALVATAAGSTAGFLTGVTLGANLIPALVVGGLGAGYASGAMVAGWKSYRNTGDLGQALFDASQGGLQEGAFNLLGAGVGRGLGVLATRGVGLGDDGYERRQVLAEYGVPSRWNRR